MALILDTNALSAFVDGEVEIASVISAHQHQLALPVIAYGEFLFGIRRSRLRSEYERWLHEHLGLFHLLPVDEATAPCYASVRQELRDAGRPMPSNDVWIAALARQHGDAILSRDRHFAAVPGLQLLSW